MLPEQEVLRVRSLARVAHALGRSQQLSRMLETAAEETCTAVGAASVSVSRLESGTGNVRTLINVGDLGVSESRWPEDEVYSSAEFPNLQRVVDAESSWEIAVDDPDADPREVGLLRELGKGSATGTPLVVDGQLWGEFYATRRPDQPRFGADEMAYLEALTAILSGAVSRVLREESLSELAFHDPLTGLLNRRALDERAALGFQVPAGSSREITVVVVDINGLKRVNDTMGHLAGDQLIKAVGSSLQHAFAPLPGSLVARVGGDEFVVLCIGNPVTRVLAIADTLCRRTWDFGAPADVSCGAASVTMTAADQVAPHDLFAAADRAQYVAKRGRIRETILAEDATGLPGSAVGAVGSDGARAS